MRSMRFRKFADVHLGKGVVECKDTPGFIANRIGVYWMMTGLLEAMRIGISVEAADAVMGRPAGIPKTGVFGLIDLIGIDLMPLIAKEMLHTLDKNDPFREALSRAAAGRQNDRRRIYRAQRQRRFLPSY